MEPEGSLPHSQVPATCPYPKPSRLSVQVRGCRKHFVTGYFFFYCEKLLAPRPTPKLEDHPLFLVRDCLFSIFAASFHIEGRSSIRNLRTRQAVVTGTHLSRRARRMLSTSWRHISKVYYCSILPSTYLFPRFFTFMFSCKNCICIS